MSAKTVVLEEAVEAAARAITARYGDPVRRWKQDVDDAKVALEAAAPFIAAKALEDAAAMIRDLIDRADCWFDHHGGCQSHGYLSL